MQITLVTHPSKVARRMDLGLHAFVEELVRLVINIASRSGVCLIIILSVSL